VSGGARVTPLGCAAAFTVDVVVEDQLNVDLEHGHGLFTAHITGIGA
jgi:hypothetical protein